MKSTVKRGPKQSKQQRVTMSTGDSGIMKTYFGDSESPGIKVTPMTVLIGSLVFIFVVILMHFYGRFFLRH
jgi:preprotein translocase subunit Sec61beta